MPVAPQSVRTQSSCQYLFTLLEPMSVKAVHRTLMKLSPSVNFINIVTREKLHEAFMYEKIVHKMLMKLTTGSHLTLKLKLIVLQLTLL